MKFASLSFGAILGLITKSNAKPAEELVTSLPQMETFAYGVYSGFIDIKDTSKSLHYLLAESQGDWEKDPLIIWTNGGPGCSSLLAFTTENGPFTMLDNTTTFVKNDYSWNKNANVLYIEHPAGVGYSTCNKASKGDCDSSDMNDSIDNLIMI